MVRRDEIDLAVHESAPQTIAIGSGPDRGRALERGRALADRLGSKRQIVRTGFHRDGDAARTGSGDRLERRRRCEVDDVNPHAVVAGQAHETIDCLLLGSRRPALEPRRMAAAVACGFAQRARPFGVHEERQAERRQHGHGLIEILLVDMPEFVHSRRTEKTLEAEHAGSCERLELIHIARHHPAPERYVHMTLARGGAALRRRAPQPTSSRECC